MSIKRFIVVCVLVSCVPMVALAKHRARAGGEMGVLHVSVVGGSHVNLVIHRARRHGSRTVRRTNAAGIVSMRMAAGRYIISARRSGHGSGRAVATVRAGQVSSVILNLRGVRFSLHPHQAHLLGVRVEHPKADAKHKAAPQPSNQLPQRAPGRAPAQSPGKEK
jgi:hypothetical protein